VGAENAGPKNEGPMILSLRDQKCGTEKCGTETCRTENAGLKMQDWKMQYLENEGPGVQIEYIYACVNRHQFYMYPHVELMSV